MAHIIHNDVEMVDNIQESRVTTSNGTSQVSKETPISQGVGLAYGLPETHTCILPWTTFMSYGVLDHDAPLQLALRMNSLWDMMTNGIGTLAAGATIATKGFYPLPVGPSGTNINGAVFPQAPGSLATEMPQWRNYFASLYDFYTVTSCKYRITIINTGNARGADAIVGVQFDSYSDTATSTGNVMPQTKLIEALHFKGINWHVITSSSTEQSTTGGNKYVIEGVYKPGSIKRNIVNDGDVKTWTSTAISTPVLPNLKDILTINLWKAPLNYATAAQTCGNIQVELQYIVQFKDLKLQARYPNTLITNQSILQEISSGITDEVRQLQ